MLRNFSQIFDWFLQVYMYDLLEAYALMMLMISLTISLFFISI